MKTSMAQHLGLYLSQDVLYLLNPIVSNLGKVCNALLEISGSTKDPKVKSETMSLANIKFADKFV